METYLEVIPQEIIGEIIEYINNIKDLDNLKQVSPYVSDAVNKYVRKVSLRDIQDWHDVKQILTNYNSINKIMTNFKIFLSEGLLLLIFKDKKYTICNCDYETKIDTERYYSDAISKHFPQLEYIDIININKLKYKDKYNKKFKGIHLLRINRTFIDFCLEVNFRDKKLTDLIRIILAGGLIDHLNCISILLIYTNDNMIIDGEIVLNRLFLKYFKNYLNLPIKSWHDISGGMVSKMFKFDEDTYDLFDMPVLSKDKLDDMFEQYEILEKMLDKETEGIASETSAFC